MPQYGRLAILMLCALWLGAPGRSVADIELPAPPPPQPVGQTVQAPVGGTVEIPLRGVSRSGLQLKFLLRPPQVHLGELSELRVTGVTTAVMTYRHDPAKGEGTDRFRYAVQGPNTGVSTPADVVIRVVEPGPVFVAPAWLEFPAIAAGESVTQEIEIANTGGGVISGQLTVPRPWRIDGDATYRLRGGNRRQMRIVFEPKGGELHAGTARFSHDAEWQLSLAGRTFSPVEVAPRRIELKSTLGSVERRGEFILRNRSDRERTVRLAAPEGLVVDAEATLPAESETPMVLRTAEGVLGTRQGELIVQGENVNVRTPVTVFAAPARLEVSPPGPIALGEIRHDAAPRVRLTVKNVGGADAQIRASVPKGFSLRPNPADEPLAPGFERSFDLAVDLLPPGRVNGEVTLTADMSQVRLPLTARVLPRPESLGPASGVVSPTAPSLRQVQPNAIPPVQKIGVVRHTTNELELVWKNPSPDAVRFYVLERKFDHAARGAKFRLVARDDFAIRTEGDYVFAAVKNLRPGTVLPLSVVAVDSEGRPSQPSAIFRMQTKPKPQIHIPILPFMLLALAVLIVFIVRQRRRREQIEEEVMMERIEKI
jgi:hypothetical protein